MGRYAVMSIECTEPHLGLASTRQLLQELECRGRMEPRYEAEGAAMKIQADILLGTLPGSMLDYRTVDDG